MIEHLGVDCLRRAAERQFSQGGKVRLREEMTKCACRFLRQVDLAFLQPFDQFGGRDIHHLNLCLVKDCVRHRLTHANAGEGSNDVVQALDMLDVDGRIDIYAGVEQFFDILIALGMAAAGSIGVRQFIDQCELRAAREQFVQMHFGQHVTLMVYRAARQDFEPARQGFGFGTAMGFDDPHDDIDAGLAAGHALRQHLKGLADAGRGAKEDFQLAPPFLRGCAQEGFGRRSIPLRQRVPPVRRFASWSSCRLSAKRFTRSSPRKPSSGWSTFWFTRSRICASGNPRARATRFTCTRAEAGDR